MTTTSQCTYASPKPCGRPPVKGLTYCAKHARSVAAMLKRQAEELLQERHQILKKVDATSVTR